MNFLVVGLGAVGARAARQLVSTDAVDTVLLHDVDEERAKAASASLGPKASVSPALPDQPVDVVLIARPPGGHRSTAERHLERGAHVVSTSDALQDVRGLLDLDPEARERERHVVIGAAFSPGLTCALVRHAAADFDEVDEVHVAKVGTGGPSCARHRQRALVGKAVDWRDGGWTERRSGTGRELCWFPDPIGSEDCYRAALVDSLLIAPAFPGVDRVTARVAATRRDRMAARLGRLARPRPDGALGAVRVEVRGRRGTATEVRVLGAMDRPAVAAGGVSALAAMWAAEGRLRRHGAAGLAELLDPVPFLAELARRGIKAAVFEGTEAPIS